MGPRTRARKNGCDGKQRHADRAGAERHLQALYHSFAYKGRVYHCSFCGCWHVGRHHRRQR